jgi:hypothetical protein
MPHKTSYDSACLHLAEHFIGDKPLGTDEHLDELAQHIQTTIEDWIVAKERELDQ